MHDDTTIRFTTYTGLAIAQTLADFQRLHVMVFHEWPYLYNGDVNATPYIAPYVHNPRAALFMARKALSG